MKPRNMAVVGYGRGGRKLKGIKARYHPSNTVTIAQADCLNFLRTIPDGKAALVVTSPPYNVGKEYESKVTMAEYLRFQRNVIAECVRVTKSTGSFCWVVGNSLSPSGRILPLDLQLHPVFQEFGLQLQNRIIWHFGHGLHCQRRFSGRYETILWYTKSDEYLFNLDAVRVRQKYPGKRHYKGPNKGKYSGHPLGKNPGDVWIIPNVKAKHVEKTDHPCQFPVALVETLILALTNKRDLVVDPFLGTGTTAIAAILNGRRAAGCDIIPQYIKLARKRVRLAARGILKVRPREKEVYVPSGNSKLLRRDDN